MPVTHRRSCIVVVAVLLVAACGEDATDTDPTTTAPATPTSMPTSTPTSIALRDQSLDLLDGVEIEAALGYPRDLLDRGRVNLRIVRPDATEFTIIDKQLVADYFTTPPIEARVSVIPPSGQLVALQTLFGDVIDCDSTQPVGAELRVTYVLGDDERRTAALPLTDATTLDEIRLQICTRRMVAASNRLELRDVVVDGETAGASLVISRESGDDRIGIEGIKGTVLFGVETPFEPGTPERTLAPDETTLSIPITFVVNRCDPHAVAETTRKYGLDLYVSVNGGEAQRIDGPIDSVESALSEMLDRCKTRKGQ